MNPTRTFAYTALTAKAPHVFLRLALTLSKRGFEVLAFRSEVLGEDSERQKIHFVIRGPATQISQVEKQVLKLVDVYSLEEVRRDSRSWTKESELNQWQA